MGSTIDNVLQRDPRGGGCVDLHGFSRMSFGILIARVSVFAVKPFPPFAAAWIGCGVAGLCVVVLSCYPTANAPQSILGCLVGLFPVD